MVNRQALRDRLTQLSIRIRAAEKERDKYKKAGDNDKYAAAVRNVRKLKQERENIIKELGK